MLLLFVLFSGDLMNSFLNFKMVMIMMMMIIMMMIMMTMIMMMMIMMIMMTIHITNIINEFYCDLRVKFKRKKITLRKAKKKPERKFKLSTALEPVYYRY